MQASYHRIDIEKWSRNKQYHFFKDYELPFFELTAYVRSEKLYAFSKKEGLSFFLSFLYLSLKAANQIKEFRYRINHDEVIAYDVIHGGSTVLNEDESFSFCYFDYQESFNNYYQSAQKVLKAHYAGEPSLSAAKSRDDLIHYSVLPWVAFTSFAHATRLIKGDSVPKIVFGKYEQKGEEGQMPVSVKVHHALMDGLHVGRYYQQLESLFQHPKAHL